MLAVKKITKRWLINNFGVIVFILLAIEIIAAVAVHNYYYSSIRQILYGKANTISSDLTLHLQEANIAEFPARMRDYVAGFADKDMMELMIIDSDEKISFTSSGFYPEDTSITDYYNAVNQNQKLHSEVFKLTPGGKVMSFIILNPTANTLQQPEGSVTAIRLITSLEYADTHINSIIALMIIVGVGVLALILFSSSYFISSIVNPVGKIGDTARRIAQGNFSVRLAIKNDDEIGELCDIINHMAEELESAERIKNDFISSVSHELRTPLTAIQGWGETIQLDNGQDSELLQRGMSVIINETSRLSGMVEELLDFSRMQSGRLKLIKAPMDAMAELSEAVMMYTQRAEREGIELVFEDDASVAPVIGDKNRIRQVFINVIDNAIKYSDSKGRVTVTTKQESGNLIINVSDTGIGIKPEDLPQIKMKFYKADNTRRGSGIGLAVADDIITRHDGKLEIHSVYGMGTTVSIILPIKNKAEKQPSAEEHTAEAAEDKGDQLNKG